jgi:hypothetical protein
LLEDVAFAGSHWRILGTTRGHTMEEVTLCSSQSRKGE